MDPIYIDDDRALADLCQSLRDAPYLALDTEFMRERTYFPQLCLIQLGAPGTIACIDPLRVSELAPLRELLLDPGIDKVLHAAHQDLELFFHRWQVVPAPVFDTQLAASLLGHGHQLGYAALVQQLLGTSLSKAHSRADWSRRPLSAAELVYAADDVRYLMPVYERLHAELAAKDRLDWLQAEAALAAEPGRYRPDPAQAWQRIGRTGSLKPASLAVLQGLAAWREQQAVDADRPRQWLLKDDILVDIARRLPQEISQLQRIRNLPEATLRKHGQTLLALVERHRDAPAPEVRGRAPLGPAGEAAVDLLNATLRLEAARLQIAPQALAGRRELEALAAGATPTEILGGWRSAAVGPALEAALAGRTALRIAPRPASGPAAAELLDVAGEEAP